MWNGRAQLTDAAGTWRIPAGWSISKRAVARGAHEIVLRPVAGAATPQGTVQVLEDGIALRDVTLELPAQSLLGAIPARGLPVLGGTVLVTSSAFTRTATGGSGALRAQWRGARLVVGDAAADLGTVDLAVTAQGNGLAGRLTNGGGDVRIDGNVALASSTVTVEATVTPAPGAPATLSRALAALGTPEAGGSVRIVWRGSLR